MKKIIQNKIKMLTVVILLLLTGTSVYAESMNFGFYAGLALPNDNVSQFFDNAKKTVQLDSITEKPGQFLLNKAASDGYILGIKGRIGLSDRFDLAIGIGIARFNDGQYDLTVPDKNGRNTTVARVQTTSNIIPISAGLNAYLFKSFIGLYATAEVNYNYILYSYDMFWNDAPAIPVATNESESRIGYGIGAGIDFDLSLFKINFEAKFNTINLIGRSNDEQAKNYGTLTVGIVF